MYFIPFARGQISHQFILPFILMRNLPVFFPVSAMIFSASGAISFKLSPADALYGLQYDLYPPGRNNHFRKWASEIMFSMVSRLISIPMIPTDSFSI